MRHLLLLLLAAVVTSASAETFTYDFSRSVAAGWTSQPVPFGFDLGTNLRGTQYNAAGGPTARLTLRGGVGVTRVTVLCSTNSDAQNTLALTVGETPWGTLAPQQGTQNAPLTFEGSATGDIVLVLTLKKKSVYISEIVIEAEAVGAAAETADSLDTAYVYAEPTLLRPTGDVGRGLAYAFTQSNIHTAVSCGTESTKYFGVDAGERITFTAARPIRAIALTGYLAPDFTATATSGTLTHSAGGTDGAPVLLLTGIDTTSVTLTCTAELRTFEAALYFDAAPDCALTTPADHYSYAAEPAAATPQDVAFEAINLVDLYDRLGYNQLYFYNDYVDLLLPLPSPTEPRTYVVPGTYTVAPSQGRHSYYDAARDQFVSEDLPPLFRLYDRDYNATPYYIADGRLDVAVTGDTLLTMTFEGATQAGTPLRATYAEALPAPDAILAPAARASALPRKRLVGRRIVITHEGRQYSTTGTRIK